MGMTEEVNRWLAGQGAELLDHADHLAAEKGFARGPDLRLVWVVKLGKDEIDPVIDGSILQNQSEPVQLFLDAIAGIGIEGDDPDIAMIEIMPVLLVTSGTVGRQLQVIEVILCIRLMISQRRNQRHMPIEQFSLSKEVILPVRMIGSGRDQISRYQ